ncbi:hypothetical protein CEP48_00385 [Mergibacter septicus]|uniref:Uncharacterized protein n=1 Tax=Mergibacter septicus TaxID=221402 RepID=A0A8E3MEX8_9PAST|nr:MobH family relaxase [Mergibacter septicus]AWX14738.1 hypothetical protein CEP47_00385 [Mergibacter septicus]QDJ13989.1 hypothetical protein CEP48_00385 [Mergibacter septicus]UTU48562.1 TraI domain-containing protein [Mergibacter septicus]WMR95809.1 MobH family relaxase [Mergibacter septicus]
MYWLRSLFKRKNLPVANIKNELSPGWIYPEHATKLLDTQLRKKLVRLIYQNVSMSENLFNTLYRTAIERYAELVQLLPASENHHHSYEGGMLDHGLEVVSIAVKLRQSYLLPPNSAPEDQSRQSEMWTAAVIYAALVHDIAKIVVDIEIEVQGEGRWFPWHGTIKKPYRFKYIKNRDYNLHHVMGAMIGSYLIPITGLNWLAKNNDVFNALMYFAAGHYDKSGVLSEIVQKADQTSVAQFLGGDVSKIQQPTRSLSQQILIALRYLLEHELQLNNSKGGSDGWLTDDSLWLMSKTVTDKVRAYLLQQGVNVPSQNSRLFDEMQSHNIIESTPENKAIWHCKISSNSGWQPENSFTLLKLSPSKIWTNIEQRPELFNGTVTVDISKTGSEDTVDISKTGSEDTVDISKTEPEDNSKAENSKTESGTDIDFTLNLFKSTNSELDVDTNFCDGSQNFKINQQDMLEVTLNDINHSNKLNLPDLNNTNEFLNWIKMGISSRKLSVNEANAKLHIVNQSVFLVSPGIFQKYSLEKFGTKEHWKCIQKNFQKLGLHKKNSDLNIWTCEIIGPRKRTCVKGYLVSDMSLFFGDKQCFDNMYLTLLENTNNG